MKILLQKDFKSLGNTGEIVIVKDGYARNYLIPQGIAVKADKSAMKQLAEQQRILELRRGKEQRKAEKLADKIRSLVLVIKIQTGEDDKLFGSVTNQDIADLLKEQGINIDRRIIHIADPIKTLGNYQIPVKLHQKVSVNLNLSVMKV